MTDKDKKQKNIKLVATSYQRSGDYDQSSFDGLQMYKYLDLVLRKSDKDAIIRALMDEICYLTHFIAHKDDEYVKFRNKAKNTPIRDDDFLEWTLNPPSMNDSDVKTDYSVSDTDDGENQSFAWEKEQG